MRNILIIAIVLLPLLGCQPAQQEPTHDIPSEGIHIINVGRIFKVEPVTRLHDGHQMSTVETLSGFFTVYGVPTFTKWSEVQKQGDYLYIKDENGVVKKYRLL